jgi:acetylornithine deacetylase
MSVEETLAALVAFPTVSDRPVTGIAAWLAQRCEDAGLTVERLEAPGEGKCNLVCRKGPVGTDGLVLSGHMDVVPVDGQPWTSDPFRLTRRGDRLVGRGACDMKAFLAAVVEALPLVGRLERELVLVWTCDEEVGCLGSRDLAEKRAGRPVPSLCLIGEPTSFRILRMHPGHTAVRLTCRGRAAHSSRPDLGENAIRKVAPVLSALDALADEWRRDRRFEDLLDRPYVVMNVGRIAGGTAINVVPDRCTLDVGFRPLPGMDEASLVARIAERVSPHATVETLRVTPPLLTEEGTALEDLLRPHATDPRLGAASYATDGGNLAKLGTRTLVFGPGSIEVAHQADEFVPVAELNRCVEVVADVVRRRCG